jgi:hypothetical protein
LGVVPVQVQNVPTPTALLVLRPKMV